MSKSKISIESSGLSKVDMQKAVEVAHELFALLDMSNNCIQLFKAKVLGILKNRFPATDGVLYTVIFDQPGAENETAQVEFHCRKEETAETIVQELARKLVERKLMYVKARVRAVDDLLIQEVVGIKDFFSLGSGFIDLELRTALNNLARSKDRALEVLPT